MGEELFSAEAAMLGLASSGVCSLGMSGAVVFVVCGTGLLLLEEEDEGAADVAEADESSCISPRLSKTLESETRRSVTKCILLVTHQNEVKERDKSNLSQELIQNSLITVGRKPKI